MHRLDQTLSAITDVEASYGVEMQKVLDNKTKPRRSLGRLEDVACQIASILRTVDLPQLPKAIVVMGGDHGVAAEGVSAYPSEVTHQMLLNFASGGAAINVLARHAGAKVIVVDMGVGKPLPPMTEIRSHRMGPGTFNFTLGPAMTRETAREAIEVGIEIARELVAQGIRVIGLGDMGIGNTTASSAIASVLTGAPPEEVTGRGTGVDEEGYKRKIVAIRKGLEVNKPDPRDAIDVLAKLGGFEIAGLVGVVLGCAAARVPVVIDGFISGASALCAVRMAPKAQGYLIASHRSVEVGHQLVLKSMDKKPLLDLELRLGEGTGAALAMGLVDASLKILHEMATFGAAHVSDSGA